MLYLLLSLSSKYGFAHRQLGLFQHRAKQWFSVCRKCTIQMSLFCHQGLSCDAIPNGKPCSECLYVGYQWCVVNKVIQKDQIIADNFLLFKKVHIIYTDSPQKFSCCQLVFKKSSKNGSSCILLPEVGSVLQRQYSLEHQVKLIMQLHSLCCFKQTQATEAETERRNQWGRCQRTKVAEAKMCHGLALQQQSGHGWVLAQKSQQLCHWITLWHTEIQWLSTWKRHEQSNYPEVCCLV